MKRVLIVGESPLVEEYASLCKNEKLDVQVRFNVGEKAGPLPQGTKHIAKPGKSVDVAFELTNTSLATKRQNLADLEKGLGAKIPILTSSLTATLLEQATWLNTPKRLIGIGALPTLLQGSLVELTHAPMTDAKHLASAKAFLEKLGKQHATVEDSVGMVLPRILCMLTNEACFALMDRVALGNEIDTAMKLGTNYPRGPVEWAETIGFNQVLAVMNALYRSFGEERYRVSPLLQRAASLGFLPSR